MRVDAQDIGFVSIVELCESTCHSGSFALRVMCTRDTDVVHSRTMGERERRGEAETVDSDSEGKKRESQGPGADRMTWAGESCGP
jgi:hypothetical protein